MPTNDPKPVTAQELAAALFDALQRNDTARVAARIIAPNTPAQEAIEEYTAIDRDLQTLPLSQ
jgi:hypothetical protein